MNPVFIYFNEATLKENNKFTLDFSDNDIVHQINFSPKFEYYVCSLHCNFTESNQIYNESKKKLVDDLSQKSRELLSKGATYQNDIGHLQSILTDNFNMPNIAPQKYNLVLDPKVLDNNCFNFKFFDVFDKRVKDAKIYSPFSHLKSDGFLFRGDSSSTHADTVSIKLIDDYKKIQSVFFQDENTKWAYENNLYKDYNAMLGRDREADGKFKWYGTNPNIVLKAASYAMEKRSFRASEFFKYFYVDNNFGRGCHVVRNLIQRFTHPQNQKRLQPFVQRANCIKIKKNERFFIPGPLGRNENTITDSILQNCTWLGTHVLNDDDKTQINAL